MKPDRAAADTIRAACPTDAERIATLIAEVATKFILFEFSPQSRARFLASHTAQAMASRLAHGFSYHVAEFRGELVGVAGVRDNAHLFHLFVAEPFQGKGLGRKLWEHAKAKCCAAGNPGIFTVNSSQNAVAVYERFGFTVTGPIQTVEGIQFVPMKLDLSK